MGPFSATMPVRVAVCGQLKCFLLTSPAGADIFTVAGYWYIFSAPHCSTPKRSSKGVI